MPWSVERRVSIAVQAVLIIALASWSLGRASAAVLVSREPSPSGGLITSSWVDPEGSDADQYAFDSFVLAADASITEVRWRGGYVHNATLPNGSRDMVRDFRITFYATNPTGYEPLCGNPHLTETVYLADFWAGSNAGETPAGTIGGKEMYDYAYVLPAPFSAQAGVKYWIKIEGSQGMYPDWGIAVGTGENNSHYHFDSGAMMFSFRTGDTAFTLIGPGPEPYTVADVTRALGIGAGLFEPAGDELTRLNAETDGPSAGVIDASDALHIARKVAGLDPNP